MQTFLRVTTTLCAMVCGFFLQAGEMRTWTDSTGKFKVEAELVRIEGDKVVIKKSDGKFLTMPLDKLSKKDREFVEESKTNPFAGGEDVDNPFAGGEDAAPPAERSTRTERSTPRSDSRATGRTGSRTSSRSSRSSSRDRQTAKGPEDFSDDGGSVFDSDPKPVSLRRGIEGGNGGSDTSWTCEADPAKHEEIEDPRNLSFAFGEVPFGVNTKSGGFAVYYAGKKPRVLAVTNLDMDRKEGNSMSLVFFGEPDSGRCDCLRFAPKVKLLGVSPDGTKALFREEPWGFGTHKGELNYIHVVKIDGTKLSPLAAYEPFSDDSEPGKTHNWDVDVEDGDWVDNEHVMLTSRKRLIVMNAASGQVVWKMATPGGQTHFAFSPGRKYCVLSNSSGAALLNSMTGRMIGRLDGTTRSMSSMKFAFSPDGSMIASAGSDGVMLWSATDGKAEEPFYIGPTGYSPQPRWSDNRFLLIGGSLVDVRTKSLAWNYNVNDESRFFAGQFWFVSGSGRDGQRLVAVRIPHSKALLASAAPESHRFCIRPGMEVSLKIDGSVREGRDEIQKKMISMLRENELVLKPNVPVAMALKVEQMEEATTSYVTGRGFGPPMPMFGHGGGTEVKYRPSKFTIEFVKDGQTLWSTSKTTSSPNNIPLDDVKTASLQSIVDKAMAKANGEYKEWFLKAKIPKRIPNPEAAGRSNLSHTGIQDM